MTKPPKYWNKAKKYLSKKDKIMKTLIYKYRDKTLTTRKDIFYSLCKSIIGQQISVAAANSVFKKPVLNFFITFLNTGSFFASFILAAFQYLGALLMSCSRNLFFKKNFPSKNN